MATLTPITKEDLLVRLSKLKAENSLLRNQLVECGKVRSTVSELEHKLESRTSEKIQQLEKLLEEANQKIKTHEAVVNQIKSAYQVKKIDKYRKKIESQKAVIRNLLSKAK